MSEPKSEHPKGEPGLLRLINHPLFYLAGSALGLVGFALGWIKDESVLYVVLGAAIYGTFTWFRNRQTVKSDKTAGKSS
jgi:hypothetical protein